MSEIISGDAGRIGFLICGDYDEVTTYSFLDIVYYNNSSYVAKKETTGHPPEENSEFWHIFAKGSFITKSIVSGVKGSAEAEYRTGDVNISKTNIGLGNVENYKQAKEGIYGDTSVNHGRKANSASGENSFSFGEDLESSGRSSAVFGINNVSAGTCSFVEGYNNIASGDTCHAEGNETIASGIRSHAEGYRAYAKGVNSHAEGNNSTSYAHSSHAEGVNCTAATSYSHAEGGGSVALGLVSHTEGAQNIAGNGSILKVIGYNAENKIFMFDSSYENFSSAFQNIEIGSLIHVTNSQYLNTADRFTVKAINAETNSIAVEENLSTSSGYTPYMAVLVKDNTSGAPAHAEGRSTIASGFNSHSEGFYTIASGASSHAGGSYTEAKNYASRSVGKYNVSMTSGGTISNVAGHAFVVGNGTSGSARSNAFSVMFDGTVKAGGTITASTAADYAEFFEWSDKNSFGEDRIGRFVTLEGNKIKIANKEDEYILGIISGMPCILGNGDCDAWNGMYLRDDFGRIIMESSPKMIEKEDGEFQEVFDSNGDPVYEGKRPVLNPDYDPSKEYISRSERPEWSAVGMLGVLAVYDDGSCKVNGYCKCGENGIATSSSVGYRVVKRLHDNIVKIVFR